MRYARLRGIGGVARGKMRYFEFFIFYSGYEEFDCFKSNCDKSVHIRETILYAGPISARNHA